MQPSDGNDGFWETHSLTADNRRRSVQPKEKVIIQNAVLKAFVVLGLLALVPASIQAAERPNIVIILTDDMGFSDLGCFGGEIQTPNIDSLAGNGIRFTEFYNTARCWPTRATLMTGCYENGLRTNHVTIPQVLKTAGYNTAMVGKWHLEPELDPDGLNAPINRGFDDFYGTLAGAGSYYDPETLTRNRTIIEPEGADFYYTDRIGDEAVRQIESLANSEKPFFQYVAFTAAHWPLHAPEETVQKYIKRYEDGWEKLRQDRYARMLELGIIDENRFPLPAMEPDVEPWNEVEDKPWHIRNMAIYAAMVDHMDQAVGRIISALKNTGQLDNTLIIYCHDNGACSEHLGGNAWNTANRILEKARSQEKTIAVGDVYSVPMGGPLTYGSVGHNWACAQNTPMRRYKANVHNGGACTPAIMHWPAGLKKPGTITRNRGHVVDMMATCLELADAEYPGRFNDVPIKPHASLSLVPAITGKELPRDHAYFFKHGGTDAVVKGDFKIVRERQGEWALYDLSVNRTETRNIADQRPEIVRELATLWVHWSEQ